MVKGLYTAYTGMIMEQNRMDILSNNLANSATNGYKKEGCTARAFEDQLVLKIKDTSEYNIPKKLGYVNMGVKIGETYTDWSQGNFEVTDNAEDVAIAGDGFFALSFTNKQGETSVKYTRDGAFKVNAAGYLVTKDGDYVLNQNGAMNGDPGAGNYIRLDPTQTFRVDELGNIIQNNQIVARIGVVDFEDYNYLQEYGENMYNLVEGGQAIASDATVEQGTLEKSNVNVVTEMVDMITVSRAYEANQKLIQTIDSTLEKAVNNVGKA